MKIAELMTRNVRPCSPRSSLAHAAQLMWDHDIGALPVVDDEQRVIGMITDRDICMAAYMRGEKLADIRVQDVMSRDVVTCVEGASDKEAARVMASARIHRVPVVDAGRRLVGIVSLNDLALAMRRGRPVPASEVAETLASVCEPRRQAASATA